MKYTLPFYAASLEKPAANVYHTHPKCRVGQQIEPGNRMIGMGEGRKECPFCFVLGQLSATKALNKSRVAGHAGPTPLPADYSASPLNGPTRAQ